jgi:O-antigen/teichoic acid export membrane protein
MPVMGKILNEDNFATFIIFISIFSVVSNSLGSELGIVRQILEHKKKDREYNTIIVFLATLSFFISIIGALFLKFSVIDSAMLSIAVALANIRLYCGAYFRMNKTFFKVLLQNILYLVGMGIGLFVFYRTHIIWAPLVFAELLAIAYSVYNSDFKRIRFEQDYLKLDKGILLKFKDYGIVELITNMMVYFDKLIIYPILGPLAVNTYYATNTTSKISALIINPLNGVIISWLKNDDKAGKKRYIKFALKYTLPIIIVVTLLNIPVIYLAVKILYSQYLDSSLQIVVPIAASVGIGTASSLIRSLVLKYRKSTELLSIYINYTVVFIVFSFAFSYIWGLFGFAISCAITRTYLLCLFVVKLKNVVNEKTH